MVMYDRSGAGHDQWSYAANHRVRIHVGTRASLTASATHNKAPLFKTAVAPATECIKRYKDKTHVLYLSSAYISALYCVAASSMRPAAVTKMGCPGFKVRWGGGWSSCSQKREPLLPQTYNKTQIQRLNNSTYRQGATRLDETYIYNTILESQTTDRMLLLGTCIKTYQT
jgi:hypothetical protein